MKVKLIRRIGPKSPTALIEWIDAQAHTRRAYLPHRLLTDLQGEHRSNEYDAAQPDAGAPYGVPFAQLLELTATAEAIEAALHQAGIWTADEIERDHLRALGAMQSVYAKDLIGLIRSSKNYNKQAGKA